MSQIAASPWSGPVETVSGSAESGLGCPRIPPACPHADGCTAAPRVQAAGPVRTCWHLGLLDGHGKEIIKLLLALLLELLLVLQGCASEQLANLARVRGGHPASEQAAPRL